MRVPPPLKHTPLVPLPTCNQQRRRSYVTIASSRRLTSLSKHALDVVLPSIAANLAKHNTGRHTKRHAKEQANLETVSAGMVFSRSRGVWPPLRVFLCDLFNFNTFHCARMCTGKLAYSYSHRINSSMCACPSTRKQGHRECCQCTLGSRTDTMSLEDRRNGHWQSTLVSLSSWHGHGHFRAWSLSCMIDSRMVPMLEWDWLFSSSIAWGSARGEETEKERCEARTALREWGPGWLRNHQRDTVSLSSFKLSNMLEHTFTTGLTVHLIRDYNLPQWYWITVVTYGTISSSWSSTSNSWSVIQQRSCEN